MRTKHLLLAILCFITFISYSQSPNILDKNNVDQPSKTVIKKTKPLHEYGGWYCPDNLKGFPAVDINDWKKVSVVNGRMATEKETKNGTSLIFVDHEKYPDATPLDMELPRLARFYNISTRKDEIVIIIQAISISNNSIVGFRYLNGGNGSARLDEVKFLTDNEIDKVPASLFVAFDISINAPYYEIWNVLTKPEYSKILQCIFDNEDRLKFDWHKSSKVNYKYLNNGILTADFAANLFGNMYIQIDWEKDDYQYVEKFMLLENKQTKTTTLRIVCGPYGDDYEDQKYILEEWAEKVKEVSENKSSFNRLFRKK